ncbi:YcnI family protein [Actinomadura sp. DC4]|uniref:YcnI family protein n=1 Tax=Actinomadura sp. DC4 TaxID=3055069 RepID=UPI0025B22C43|nr:YcnI family protein [Actinomadura sp. DC4]MDN3351833.1 YcnI family protein [Actinomadura sp. DC4]
MRTFQRAAAVSGLAALALTAVATAASAHVTANPSTAEPGSYSKVSFRVPNEEPKADTTKLEITLPTDHPIASVSVRPVPGWSVKVTSAKLATPLKSDDGEITKAVSTITWSGGKITPGQFQEFDVSMGPLPTDTDRLMFKTAQTYSNGEVVNWDQDPGNGGQEPEHPAPTVRLVKAAGAGTAPKAAPSSTDSSDGTARWLGGLGLAAGIIGLAAGVYGLTRKRAA